MLRTILFFILLTVTFRAFAAEPLRFGVLNQRSILLTAQLWNPILQYVSAKSGVPLRLSMGKTAQATMGMVERGELDFIYTNLLFTPEHDKLGYHVIARFNTPGIRGQVVIRADSPYRNLADLNGERVAFPMPEGFAGYKLPMQALLLAGAKIQPVFAGNQEAAMAHLQLGHVAAAGVNSGLMANYARREGFEYRVLYSSEIYPDLPVMVNPRVPATQVKQVQQALLGMKDDRVGRQILQTVSRLVRSDQVLGFVATSDKEYDGYRQFYRTTLVKD